jgi:hypothetical protein
VNKNIIFDIDKRNFKKCASCVNNFLCNHKTGKFTKLSLPYDIEYFNKIKSYTPNVNSLEIKDMILEKFTHLPPPEVASS